MRKRTVPGGGAVHLFLALLFALGAALGPAAPRPAGGPGAGAQSRLKGGRTFRVEPGRPLKSLRATVPRLRAGDTVLIAPGVYREVVRLRASGRPGAPITLKGVLEGGRRPVFDAEGLDVSGRGSVPRAILQIEGAHWRIENLEFRNARNGENAAGIRLLHARDTVIVNVKIRSCDMGIFGDDLGTLTIERSDIAECSTKERPGYAHNLYVSGNRIVVRGSWIHDCPYGQNFKSRAHLNELWYNWISDSDEGEVGPVDGGKWTAEAGSDTLLAGNVIVSKPDRSGNRVKFILFGSESGGRHDGTLYLLNNTFVAGSPRIVFVILSDPSARLVAWNNIFYGSRRILRLARPALAVEGRNNWVEEGASIPAGFRDTIRGRTPGFADPARRDFRLRPDSPCVGAGLPELRIPLGGKERRLAVEFEYEPHLRLRPRPAARRRDVGAYGAIEAR